MDARRLHSLATLTLVALLFSGCRADPKTDAYLASVNAEKRALEDAIYDLQYRNELLEEKLERATGEGAATEDRSDTPDASVDVDVDPNYTPLITPPSGRDDAPAPASPVVEPPENPDLSPPMTDPGVPVPPEQIFPLGPRGAQGPSLDGADGSLASAPLASAPADATPIADPDSPVTHLHINRIATRGRNTDGQPGDDAITIGLEPRDQYGRFVPAANPVSAVLLDPELEGQSARVASWEFSPEQVAEGAKHAAATPMILLEAAWPKRPPKNSRLKLWVRYSTPEGRVLQTSHTIQIEVDGEYSARWTPRRSQTPSMAEATESDPQSPQWSPERR